MRAYLFVSEHDQEVICTALRHVGYETVTIVRTPDEISAEAGLYHIAVVQLYHGDPLAPPERLAADDTLAVDIIRAMCTKHPTCPILAITDSRITGDAQIAFEAGADWFQSVDWAVQVSLESLLSGQIDHAVRLRAIKSAA